MTVALSLPFEDEHLYSLISRYIVATRVRVPSTAVRFLFHRQIAPSRELLCGLDVVARETETTFGWGPIEIAERLTLLPYEWSFLPDEKRVKAREALTNGSALAPILAFHQRRFVQPATLRFCPMCVASDSLYAGEPYWRRAHQLPGVVLCTKHGCPLRISQRFREFRRPLDSTSRQGKTRPAWVTVQQILAEDNTVDCDSASQFAGNYHLLEVMRKSVELLGRSSDMRTDCGNISYRCRAEAAGFLGPHGRLDVKGLRAAITKLFGNGYLQSVGLELDRSLKDPWPSRMILRPQSTYHPLQHLLLIYFFNALAASSSAATLATHASPPLQVICPSPYASHGPDHFVEKVRDFDGFGNAPLVRCICSCGVRFSFLRSANGSFDADKVRWTTFGRDWRMAARQMKERGNTNVEIANEMHVSLQTVARMLRSADAGSAQRLPGAPSANQIVGWRREWCNVLASNAPCSQRRARQINPSVFHYLRTYDRDWLTQTSRNRPTDGPPVACAADWKKRDKEWPKLLVDARDKLIAKHPNLMRATKEAILIESGLPVSSRTVSRWLPQCHSTLCRLREAVEEFQIRRIKAIALELQLAGEPFNQSRILRRASIRRSRVTPLIATALSNIEEDYLPKEP